MYMWDIPSGMGWWMGLGIIWMVLFWGAVIALIVWGIRKLSGDNHTRDSVKSLDIARERYARGELTREEFSQLKKDLS